MSDQQLLEAAQEIMPVEKHGDVYFRRGDLFTPFDDDVNGDKVRQAIQLILSKKDHIIKECSSTIATACVKVANQGFIQGHVARKLGLNAVIGVGGSTLENTLAKNELLKRCDDEGCEVLVLAKVGFLSALFPLLKKATADRNPLILKMGLGNPEFKDIILNSIADQVQSLPRDLDNLVIPVGSGVSAAGILMGLKKYGIKPKKVYLVQNVSFDRTKEIDELAGFSYPYEYINLNKYPYEKWLDIQVGVGEGSFFLDGMNEAKGYEWMLENIDVKKEKTLFWIISDSGKFRQKVTKRRNKIKKY